MSETLKDLLKLQSTEEKLNILNILFVSIYPLTCHPTIIDVLMLLTAVYKTVLVEKRCTAWHKNTNILLFF